MCPWFLPSSTVAADFGVWGVVAESQPESNTQAPNRAARKKVISIKIGFLWLRRKEYTSKVKPGIKKGAIGAFFQTSACLELVNQAQSNDVVGRNTGVYEVKLLSSSRLIL
ncbi:Uncharacterised protein [Klebsiella michiganensis]|uniref:Uncharacterized protein n=1 Tax=Klebsiella michiganensis TaxID=1134687 RepID=A0A7H4PPI4_9ENTR|nr:Uncharacterised protein [Klebsiella michiganensis]